MSNYIYIFFVYHLPVLFHYDFLAVLFFTASDVINMKPSSWP